MYSALSRNKYVLGIWAHKVTAESCCVFAQNDLHSWSLRKLIIEFHALVLRHKLPALSRLEHFLEVNSYSHIRN